MTIDEILRTVTRVGGVQLAAMCDYDGIVVESQASVGTISDEHFAAWAGEMGRTAADVTGNWGGGRMRSVVFEASMGSLILADVGKGYLMVASDPTSNAGLLRTKAEQAAGALEKLLGTAVPEPGSDDPSGRIATA